MYAPLHRPGKSVFVCSWERGNVFAHDDCPPRDVYFYLFIIIIIIVIVIIITIFG